MADVAPRWEKTYISKLSDNQTSMMPEKVKFQGWHVQAGGIRWPVGTCLDNCQDSSGLPKTLARLCRFLRFKASCAQSSLEMVLTPNMHLTTAFSVSLFILIIGHRITIFLHIHLFDSLASLSYLSITRIASSLDLTTTISPGQTNYHDYQPKYCAILSSF